MTVCEKCGKRIWKPADGGQLCDRFFGDVHANCADSIEALSERARLLKNAQTASTSAAIRGI